jgi:hypothetical protein
VAVTDFPAPLDPEPPTEKERVMKTISIVKMQKIALTKTLAAAYPCCSHAF